MKTEKSAPSKQMMKRPWRALSRRYQAALQKHLRSGTGSRLPSAHRLGEQAATLGMETLDLAGIHKRALAALMRTGCSSGARDRLVKRAEIFFCETITPIKKNHRAGVEAAIRLDRKKWALSRRTAQLAAAKRHLEQGTARRKAAERALGRSEKHHAKLLKESHQLQTLWQRSARRILSAQERDRKQISHDLRDEIAQTLLGINVRILTLKRHAVTGTEGLAKDIAETKRLVEKSVRTVNRFAREFATPP